MPRSLYDASGKKCARNAPFNAKQREELVCGTLLVLRRR